MEFSGFGFVLISVMIGFIFMVIWSKNNYDVVQFDQSRIYFFQYHLNRYKKNLILLITVFIFMLIDYWQKSYNLIFLQLLIIFIMILLIGYYNILLFLLFLFGFEFNRNFSNGFHFFGVSFNILDNDDDGAL